MRRYIFCLLTALFLSATSVYAGAGHSHGPVTPVKEEQVLKNASATIAEIVKKGKLDASWGGVKPAEAKTIKGQYGQEWVVIFNNPKIADKEKKTLYVFLSLDGQYLGANYTGG